MNKNETALSMDEVALINAAFKLYEILFLHRSYKRRRGGDFTKGAIEAAERALAGLRPTAPGTDPVLVVAHFARQDDIAQAAVKSAIEMTKNDKRETWDKIRAIQLSEAERKNLSEDAPLFKMYRRTILQDAAIKDLSHPDFPSTAANLVWRLAHRVIQVHHRRAALSNA